MTYSLVGFGVSALPPALDSYPVEEKNGLFWVKEPSRTALIQFIGLNTDPYTEEENDYVRWIVAYKSSGLRTKNWILEAVADGRSIAIKPSNDTAMPAVRVVSGKTPYGVWYGAGRTGGGTYALLAGPAALIAAGERDPSPPASAESDEKPSLPGGPATLPKWVVPVVIGTAVVAAVALLK